MNFSSEIIKNNSSITNDTKDMQTTTKPPILETLSSNQNITQLLLSNNASFIDNANASFIIKTNN